ncbi:tetratricopeptide repeat protein [Paucibacter sp. APW11]|uniref:Ancillary SecYEG translocon subunit n=1 Tax=Roseateles aquae TaxID=3077235 RepID=A0ABU3P7G6_9BURK|nr:tetratricopeptide repeat protein [Paucibacter sp. APW11]MDT8998517.1 tetratricopeptide repeat protein [Paucibacter sp. APW11]
MASHLDLEEQEQLEELKAFWKRYGNLITWVLTLALAAYAGWTGWNYWQQQQAVKAAAMFDELERVAKAGELDKLNGLFSELKQRYPGTAYAAQAALLTAKLQHEKAQADAARATLGWVAENASEPPYRDIARLRLAGLQTEAKQYDEAAKTLDAVKSSELAALVADRRGDLALAQGKPDQAKAEFLKAYAGIEKTQNYRILIEAKLASLGVAVPDADKATAQGASQ